MESLLLLLITLSFFLLIHFTYSFLWIFGPSVMSLKNWLRSKNIISTRLTILWCSIVLLEELEIKSLLSLNNQSLHIHILNTVAHVYWVNIVWVFKRVKTTCSKILWCAISMIWGLGQTLTLSLIKKKTVYILLTIVVFFGVLLFF